MSVVMESALCVVALFVASLLNRCQMLCFACCERLISYAALVEVVAVPTPNPKLDACYVWLYCVVSLRVLSLLLLFFLLVLLSLVLFSLLLFLRLFAVVMFVFAFVVCVLYLAQLLSAEEMALHLSLH